MRKTPSLLIWVSLQRFSSSLSQGCNKWFLVNSPAWWVDTVATYYPSRPSQLLPKNCNKTSRQTGWKTVYFSLSSFLIISFTLRLTCSSWGEDSERGGIHRWRPHNFGFFWPLPPLCLQNLNCWSVNLGFIFLEPLTLLFGRHIWSAISIASRTMKQTVTTSRWLMRWRRRRRGRCGTRSQCFRSGGSEMLYRATDHGGQSLGYVDLDLVVSLPVFSYQVPCISFLLIKRQLVGNI